MCDVVHSRKKIIWDQVKTCGTIEVDSRRIQRIQRASAALIHRCGLTNPLSPLDGPDDGFSLSNQRHERPQRVESRP
jgi:hypothetical protein